MFADVTDYLLDVSDVRAVNVHPAASSGHTGPQTDHQHTPHTDHTHVAAEHQLGHTRGDVAVVSHDALTTQRMSQLTDD